MINFKHFFSFLAHPETTPFPPLPSQGKPPVFIALLLGYCLIHAAVNLTLTFLSPGNGGENLLLAIGQTSFATTPPWTLPLSAVEKYLLLAFFLLLQPVLYGFTFRYALVPLDWSRLRVSLGLIIGHVAFMALVPITPEVFGEKTGILIKQIIYYFFILSSGLILSYGILIYNSSISRMQGLKNLGKYWDKPFPAVFYVSVLLTILLSPVSGYTWWALLAQGIILGYAAIRLGFWHSVALHACINLLAACCT